MRRAALALALLIGMLPASASAEWQLKPFMGLTFGGGTTFLDLEQAVGKANPVIGINGALLGDVLGLDVDFGRAPGFFQRGQSLVLGSTATTLTASAVVALPRSMVGYSLRPYFAGGAGMMHVTIDGKSGAVRVSSTLPALSLGGGATGFLGKRFGMSWELRHFRSLGKGSTRGVSLDTERLAFWRATMALAIRY